ncbi:MAG: hypothetical protein J6Y42_00900 [Bacilli bacterium]|nr:hypothetical protein [Bacilli bacterium]
MKEEEIRKIYENLSDEYVSYLWSYKNNFETNEEGIHDITKKFMDLEMDLKHKYRTDLLVSNTMMYSLLEDHDENTIVIMDLKNIILFLKLNTLYSLLKTNLFSLRYNLFKLYSNYHFRYRLGSYYKIEEYIQKKFNLDIDKEEDLNLIREIEEDVHELSIGFCDESFNRTKENHNFIIKVLVETIDTLIGYMNPYLEDTPNINENSIERLVPMLKNYKELQEETKEKIREYEELKLNPFKEIKETFKDIFPLIESDPEYDFEEFELIVPKEEGVESDEL